jgi:predicted NUDIX family NTP pyrophosphohydrolase
MRKTTPNQSAGILLFRRFCDSVQVLLVHPGGPYWKNRDDGAWSIPKGLYAEGEEPFAAAKREFQEETGCIPHGTFIDLGVHRQPSGKRLAVWAVEGDFDPAAFRSNTFRMEWPPRSGRFEEFPEADRAAWFEPAEAMRKITTGQRPILEALFKILGVTP